MSEIQRLRNRRAEILAELAHLEQMRRGSITEQYVVGTRRDGTKTRRGPYVLYSYKEKGKTVSRRLTDEEQIPVYRKQIERFRRFQELSGELLGIGERMSELALSDRDEKKTSRRTSKSRKMPR